MPNIVLMTKYYKPVSASDLSNPNKQKSVKKRNYYSSRSSDGNDYMKYIDDGVKAGSDFDYMEYMTCHELSSGVFGKDGLLSKEQKKEVREKLRNTQSVIWDMVVSFDSEYGNEKINNYQDALEILKHSLPKFFKDNGLQEENIIWFAGLHRNTDNRHIHISFFEKDKTHHRANKDGLFYHNGKLTPYSLNNFKVYTEEFMSSNQYFFERYRTNLVNGTLDALALLQGRNNAERKLKLKLSELYQKMPKGKVSYMSLSMKPFRSLIGEIEDLIFKQNPHLQNEYTKLINDLKNRDDEIKKICQSHKIDFEKYLLSDKYLQDFHRRVGNKIIEYVKKYESSESYEGKSYEIQAKIRKKNKRFRTILLRQTATLNKMVEYEVENTFEEFQRRLKQAEYQRLVEEGVIEAE